MRLSLKSCGPDVRHPDLQRSEATLSHPSSVLTDPIPHCHTAMLHVTRVRGCRRFARPASCPVAVPRSHRPAGDACDVAVEGVEKLRRPVVRRNTAE